MSLNNPKGAIICPEIKCRSPHSVFWHVKASGKRVLSYVCNRHFKMVVTGRDPDGNPLEEMRAGTATLELDYGLYHQDHEEIDKMFSNAPEQWSKGWAKKQQGKQQHQLLMMVERKDND